MTAPGTYKKTWTDHSSRNDTSTSSENPHFQGSCSVHPACPSRIYIDENMSKYGRQGSERKRRRPEIEFMRKRAGIYYPTSDFVCRKGRSWKQDKQAELIAFAVQQPFDVPMQPVRPTSFTLATPFPFRLSVDLPGHPPQQLFQIFPLPEAKHTVPTSRAICPPSAAFPRPSYVQ